MYIFDHTEHKLVCMSTTALYWRDSELLFSVTKNSPQESFFSVGLVHLKSPSTVTVKFQMTTTCRQSDNSGVQFIYLKQD